MESDWFVPGPAIFDGVRTIRLRPPENWTRVILEIPRTPPSMNDNAIRSGWRGFHTAKKEWQEEIAVLLGQVEQVKKGYYQRAIAGIFMRLPARSLAQSPDPSNFAGLVNKALGDALVVSLETPTKLRYIPDDDAPHYMFGGVEFEEQSGSNRTRIVLYFQPPEEG